MEQIGKTFLQVEGTSFRGEGHKLNTDQFQPLRQGIEQGSRPEDGVRVLRAIGRAMLGRLAHKVHIIEANGENFRFKEAKRRRDSAEK